MAAPDFEEVARLINHTRTTQINVDEPKRRFEDKWVHYQGYHRVHQSQYPFEVLSLQSRATKEAIERAAREINFNGDTHVVYAPSLSRLNVENLIPVDKSHIWTTPEYLRSFLRDEFDTYLSALREQRPEIFIDPHVRTPAGIPKKVPNPLLNFLKDPESKQVDGRVAILLAEPGQGKTFMCRHLVAQLADAKAGSIPIMIDSSQWNDMPAAELRSLSKTMLHSFRYFNAPISWLDGHEEEFLRTALKADLLRVVFDGFDEYVLRSQSTVSPDEVLETLVELASSTSARILITSRTSFWQMSFPDGTFGAADGASRPLVYRIEPFTVENARNYFSQRLSESKASRAEQLFGGLRAMDQNLAGRGFILSLVADLAERGPASGSLPIPEGHPLRWLLRALCEREVLRQALPVTADDQLRILRQFAVDQVEGEEPSTATLEYAVGIVRPDLPEASLADLISKFGSHPLIERVNGEKWEFKQQQSKALLVAEYMLEATSAQLAGTAQRVVLRTEDRQDIAEIVVELVGFATKGDPVPVLRSVIGVLAPPRAPEQVTMDARRLASDLARVAVNRLMVSGTSHRERAKCLLDLGDGKSIRGLAFVGTIARYDLRGIEFKNCMFEHVTWADCQFDSSTAFVECEFSGGATPMYCKGFGQVKMHDCRLDQEARAWFSAESIREGAREYSIDDLRNDLRVLIEKFITRGGSGLKSVAAVNLKKGPIQRSKHADRIIATLLRLVLEEHEVSGTSERGLNVRKEAEEAVKFFASNNVLKGKLAVVFEQLQRDLGFGN